MRSKEQIKIILDDFDFATVNSAMGFLKWKWSYDNGEIKTPSVSDLISVAEHCLNQVANSKDDTAVCNIGGFEAEKINNVLELRFVLDKVNTLSQIFNKDAKNELARKS